MFNVGDRVKHIDKGLGTVRVLDGANIGIEFDSFPNGHSLGGVLQLHNKYGRWCHADDLTLMPSGGETSAVIHKGKTIKKGKKENNIIILDEASHMESEGGPVQSTSEASLDSNSVLEIIQKAVDVLNKNNQGADIQEAMDSLKDLLSSSQNGEQDNQQSNQNQQGGSEDNEKTIYILSVCNINVNGGKHNHKTHKIIGVKEYLEFVDKILDEGRFIYMTQKIHA